MLFSEKLCFLQKLTGTSNKQLASALSVDPSLISRMRQGRRKPPQNSTHTTVMANYFAKKCTTDYQRSALAETVGQSRIKLIVKNEVLSAILKDWLTDSESSAVQYIGQVIRDMASDPGEKGTVAVIHMENRPSEAEQSHIYYGNAGKRAATLAFFSYLLRIGKPCTILVMTDESLEWLTESPIFSKKLGAMFLRLAKEGFSFQRIAPKYTNIDEAVASFTRWLPVYMQGKMTTYYYPRIRDNVFHRTLFVVPGILSLGSSSVGFHIDSDLTFLNISPEIANAYSREFHDYLAKCLPMTTSHTHNDGGEKISDCIQRYLAMPGRKVIKYYGLPTLLTPSSTLRRVLSSNRESIAVYADLKQQYEEMISREKTTAIIRLAEPQAVCRGEVLCPVSMLVPGVAPQFYTPNEYREHLNSLLCLMEKCPDYTVVALGPSAPQDTICSCDSGLCYIIGGKDPFTLFEISEQNIVSAACNYILSFSGMGPGKKAVQRAHTMEQIQELIRALEKM